MRQGQTKNNAVDNIRKHIPSGMTNKRHISDIARDSALSVDEALTAIDSILRRNEMLLLHTKEGFWFTPASPEEVMQFIETCGLPLFIEAVNLWRAHRITMRYN